MNVSTLGSLGFSQSLEISISTVALASLNLQVFFLGDGYEQTKREGVLCPGNTFILKLLQDKHALKKNACVEKV